MFRLVILLIIGLASSRTIALDTELVKTHVINYCEREPSRALKLSCLVSANLSYVNFLDIIVTDYGERTVALCYPKIDKMSKDGLYHLVKCVVEHVSLHNNHPSPYFSESVFFINKMRSEWAAHCLSTGNTKITRCLTKKEADFKSIWSVYLHLLPLDKSHPLIKRFTHCLGNDFIVADYSEVNVCIK